MEYSPYILVDKEIDAWVFFLFYEFRILLKIVDHVILSNQILILKNQKERIKKNRRAREQNFKFRKLFMTSSRQGFKCVGARFRRLFKTNYNNIAIVGLAQNDYLLPSVAIIFWWKNIRYKRRIQNDVYNSDWL